MYPRINAKRKTCKIGRQCGLSCVPMGHECKSPLRGQARTAAEWLKRVAENPNYEKESNEKLDRRLERFNRRVNANYDKLANKQTEALLQKIRENPDSTQYAIPYWENGDRQTVTYNQLLKKVGKEKTEEAFQKVVKRHIQERYDQGSIEWKRDEQRRKARNHPLNQSKEGQKPQEQTDYEGKTNFVPKARIRKARKKLSSGMVTPEEMKSIRQLPELARSLAQKEPDKGGIRLLNDVGDIWDALASGMRLKNTIVVRSRDGVESAARITNQKKNIYVEYLATHPRNVAGGTGAIAGAGTSALIAVAKRAYTEGKGFHLTALTSAAPFYRKIGMKEVEPLHFKVEKDDILEFIKNNTRKP